MTLENEPTHSSSQQPATVVTPVMTPPAGPPDPGSPGAVSPAPRKKRGWILKAIVVVILLLVVLIAAAPTLLSTGPAVSIIVSQVNKRLNGHIQIASLSFGWFSGVKLQGVRVFDDAGAQMAQLESAVVPLPLWKAATGSYALGDVVITGGDFDARYDANGILNFSKLAKADTSGPVESKPSTSSSAPSKLPDVSGNIQLANCSGTITRPGQPTTTLKQIAGSIKIPNINQPITDQLSLTLQVGNQPEGKVTTSGTAAVIAGNLVVLDNADVHQVFDVDTLSLAALKPFVPAEKLTTLDGQVGVHGALDLVKGKAATLDVTVAGKQKISVGGPALKGDTFTTSSFTFTIPKLLATFPDGAGKWQSGHVKVGADESAQPITLAIDQGKLTIAIDAGMQSVLNLIKNGKPVDTGKLVVADNFDVAALSKQLPNLLATPKDVTVESATLTQTINANWVAGKATADVTTDMKDVKATRAKGASGAPEAITIQPIHLAVSAADLGGGHALPDLRDLNLTLSSKFANGTFQGASLADVKGKLHADLNLAKQELGQIVDLATTDIAGTVDATVDTTGELTKPPYLSNLQVVVRADNVKYAPEKGSRVNQPFVQMEMTGELHGAESSALTSIKNLAVTIKTGSALAPVTDVAITSPLVDLSKGVALHYDVDAPNLQHTSLLANAITPAPTTQPVAAAKPAAAGKTPAEPEPPKPLMFDSGSAHLSGDYSSTATSKTITSDVSAKDIAFHRGEFSYKAKPIALKLAAVIDSPVNQPTVTHINQLDGDLGIAKLTASSPIVMTTNEKASNTSGAIKLTGSMADLTAFVTAFQGEKPDALPYRGDYTLTETVATANGTNSFKGGLEVAKFQVFNGPTVTFSEDALSLTNDVSTVADGETDSDLSVNSLLLSLKSSGAANISLTGGKIEKLSTLRHMHLQPKLDYDLAKLWPIIQPMMGEKYKDMKLEGHYQRDFLVDGDYPANVPFAKAIKSLNVDGALAVGLLDYSGLNVQQLDVPFKIRNGTLTTDNPSTQKPAVANKGLLYTDAINVDLGQEPMRVSIRPNKLLLSQATINPLFAKTWLKDLINNPVFVGAEQATGLVDVTIISCDKLPLGALMNQAVPANDGSATVDVSLTNLHIGSKYVGALLGQITHDKDDANKNSFEANVKNARITIAHGVATQNIVFQTGKYNLGFNGNMNLANEQFMPLNFDIPVKVLLSNFVKDTGTIGKLPPTVTLVSTGTLTSPNFQVGPTVQKLLGDSAKNNIGDLIGKQINKAAGNKDNGDGKTPNPADLLNGLLNKNKKDQKPKP